MFVENQLLIRKAYFLSCTNGEISPKPGSLPRNLKTWLPPLQTKCEKLI